MTLIGMILVILVILVCLALSAFFSASETALFRLRSHVIEEEIKGSSGPSAVAVRELTSSSSSRLLVTLLLGNNIVNILGATLASAVAVNLLGFDVGIPVATGVMTVVVLVFGEILPKAVAASHPKGISLAVGLPLYLFHQFLRPIHLLVDRFLEPVVRKMTERLDSEHHGLSSEELLRLARAVRSEEEEGSPLAIIGATSKAAGMHVSDIMVPRTEIEAHPIGIAPEELLEKMLEGRFTRVPIFEGSIDRVRGIVHMKDLVKLVHDKQGDLTSILKPVMRVPERKPILLLLAEMQRAFCHMAMVKDEFGVTLGLLTQEDILEEIVGEIRDEFDSDELSDIRLLEDESYEVFGRVSALDFNRKTGWTVPAERGDTLGGLVFNTLGRSANRGEVVSVPGYDIVCTEVSGSRIARVRVARRPEPEASDE